MLAWLVLVVLGMGLPRALVVCQRPCCDGHVKLVQGCSAAAATTTLAAHAIEDEADDGRCSCCAQGEDERGDAWPVAGAPGCGGCVDVALGVELGQPPADGAPGLELAPLLAPTEWTVTWPRPAAIAQATPTATGPPRPDPRARLLATTQLRL